MAGNPIIEALEHVWRTIAELNRPVAVAGGIALAAWGHVRATRDVDLLVGIDAADLKPLLERLAAAGVRPKHQQPVLTVGPLRLLQLLYEPPGHTSTSKLICSWQNPPTSARLSRVESQLS